MLPPLHVELKLLGFCTLTILVCGQIERLVLALASCLRMYEQGSSTFQIRPRLQARPGSTSHEGLVSMSWSAMERKPAPFSDTVARTLSRSRVERASRSSLVTSNTSPTAR